MRPRTVAQAEAQSPDVPVVPDGSTRRRIDFWLLPGSAIILFAVVTFRCAWVGDDAYITFRTVENFYNGYGLRWNIAERVQSYTHPLWLLCLVAVEAIIRDPYFSAILLSLALSWATVGLIAVRLSTSPLKAALVVGLLSLSRGFVDYSTSGLENPLTHFILTLFIIHSFTASPHPTHLFQLSLLACLGMLNRLDLALIFAPTLLLWVGRARSRPAVAACACAFLPLLLWELFSLLYYGFPFPNTAYAKLGTGLSSDVLRYQGVQYYFWSLFYDPLTLFAMVGGLLTVRLYPIRSERITALAVASGAVLYLIYVIKIGGDFMGGRFFTAPLLVAACLIARCPCPLAPWKSGAMVAAGLLLAFNSYSPTVASGGEDTSYTVGISGIMDERLFYYHGTGLLPMLLQGRSNIEKISFVTYAHELRAKGERLITDPIALPIGFVGYYGGPELHIVDPLGLAEPLLARLPTMAGSWRIGHFPRGNPPGYMETLETGTNLIQDPSLADYYDRLQLVTRGPIWSHRRLTEIWRFNTGQNQSLIDSYLASPDYAAANKVSLF